MSLGLADTLQSELMLYGIDVQIFFPNTMFTPGYDEENKTKPAIVKKIEEGDDGVTPDQAAMTLFKGLESGHVHISGDLITNLFRACTRGSAYRANWLLDGLLDFVAYVRSFYIVTLIDSLIAQLAVPIWRMSLDKQVANHRDVHETYLTERGFFL